MKLHSPFLVLAALLAGCAPLAQQTHPEPVTAPLQAAPSQAEVDKAETEAQEKAQAKLPNVELTPKLLYGLMLAEIAGQRGQVADAAEIYSDLAKETRDPRIARRATEMPCTAGDSTLPCNRRGSGRKSIRPPRRRARP